MVEWDSITNSVRQRTDGTDRTLTPDSAKALITGILLNWSFVEHSFTNPQRLTLRTSLSPQFINSE